MNKERKKKLFHEFESELKNYIWWAFGISSSVSYICLMLLFWFLRSNMDSIWISAIISGFMVSLISLILMVVLIEKKGDTWYTEKLKKKCAECSADQSANFISYYGLVTYDELLAIEAELSTDKKPNECYVFAYCSELDNEVPAIDIIKPNLDAGVNYKVFYYDPPHKFETEDDIKEPLKGIYKPSHLHLLDNRTYPDSSIHRKSNFDIMIYKKSNEAPIGYFCLGFLPKGTKCKYDDAVYSCGRCKEHEKTLIYREISTQLAEDIFYDLLSL